MGLIIIKGVRYEQADISSPSLLDMILLQQQSRAVLQHGLSMSRLEKSKREMQRYAREQKSWEKAGKPEGSEPEMPESGMEAIAAMVFLSMRGAGQKVSFEEAASVGLDDLDFEGGPDDVEADDVEADPTGPGSDGPATLDADAPAEPPETPGLLNG
jgi:hypothetical protein